MNDFRPWETEMVLGGFARILTNDGALVADWVVEADAELIVRSVNALPSLIEALEAAYEHMSGNGEDGCICGIPSPLCEQVVAALAAAHETGVD